MSFTGAKGGSSAFKQRADTLRSNDTFEGLLVLCAGPIVGPTNGLKSQKINGTPIEDASGTANFKDVVMLSADGDPAKFPQIATLKLGAGASPVAVNLPIGNTNSAAPGPWVVKTLNNTGADSIDLRFIVNQLLRQDKKGVYEATANLEIELKPTGFTTWINPNLGIPTGTYAPEGQPITGRSGSQLKGFFQKSNFAGPSSTWTPEANNGYLSITGKTSSAYVHELRIDVPNIGVYANKGWDIRVRLREIENIEADPVYEKRTVQWESVAAVYASDVGNHEDWRGVSWIQIYGKASDQFNGAPEMEGDYLTKIVSVPPITVFNPLTRQYTAATWDGSFSKSYTNDPAWVINDALSDSIFGLSNLAPGAHLNKWDALEISKYCSQSVSDGGAGTHPRFSMNLKVTEPQRADEFIQYLAGAVSGFAWDDGNGQWRMKLDKPEIPSDILTLETIEGEFSYAHSDIDSRFNDITMSFLNEEMDFREDRVRVFDQAHINKYGRKPTTVVAVGCTHRQEALRRATLRLRASINEFRMVSYVTNRRGRLVQPFDTVLIADGDLGYRLPTGVLVSNPADVDSANNRTTGRVLSMDAPRTTLTLRDSVRVEIGVTYVVHFAIPNPAYAPNPTTQPTDPSWSMPTVTISRTLTNTSGQRGDVTTLYLNAALPASIPEYANFALEAAGLPSIPKTFRILDVKPDEDGERVAITAIEVDTAKYAAADAAVATPFSYSAPDLIVPAPLPPAGGNLLSLVTIPGEGANRVNLVVNWQRPSSLFLRGFSLRYRVNNGPLIDAVMGLQDTSFELVDPPAGTYYFEILTHDRRGATSRPLAGSLVVNGGVLQALVGTAVTAGAVTALQRGNSDLHNANADFATGLVAPFAGYSTQTLTIIPRADASGHMCRIYVAPNVAGGLFFPSYTAAVGMGYRKLVLEFIASSTLQASDWTLRLDQAGAGTVFNQSLSTMTPVGATAPLAFLVGGNTFRYEAFVPISVVTTNATMSFYCFGSYGGFADVIELGWRMANRTETDFITLRPAEVGATAGAVLGTNLRATPGGAVIPSAQLHNSSIVLNADGTASYNNGSGPVNVGAVTIGGLGYSGALNATFGAATDANGVLQGSGGVEVDNNLIVTLLSPVGRNFTANQNGVLDGQQLPATFQFKLFRGAADVSATTTWAVLSQSGVNGGTVTITNGVVSVPAGCLIGLSSSISVSALRNGATRYGTVSLTRVDAAAPPNGGTTGGTTGGDNTLNSVTGTTLVAISDEIQFTTGTSGVATFGGVLAINAAAAANVGSFGARLRWRIKPTGGSYTDVGVLISETYPADVVNEGGFISSSDGEISAVASQSGLAANTVHFAQLFGARNSATPVKTIGFGGAVSAGGS